MALAARENPFFPVAGSDLPNYSTNQVKKPKPFQSIEIEVPDSVRILKSVTLTCENLDGSVTKKEIPINKSIDWHNKIVISQQKKMPTRRICKNNKKISPHFKKIAKEPFISFYGYEKELKIITADRLLRHFKLVKPERIVLDFKRSTDFRTNSFSGTGPFEKITLGNHNGYYRVVIKLDGRYTFHIRPVKQGYLLNLE